MEYFNNCSYEALVKDLINDAFYLGARSPRGTIATIRQYAEVIVRRILDLPCDDSVTLGHNKIVSSLRIRSNDNPLLMNSLEIIRNAGNKCIHTQNTAPFTEKDVKEVIDSLFNLYAYLLVDFFEKYPFGSNSAIVSAFSILPPIIRYKTLKYLHSKDPKNLLIIDKLSLAILKAFNKQTALNWIEEKSDFLKNTPSVTIETTQSLEKSLGIELSHSLISVFPNMYDCCIMRIEAVSIEIDSNGKLYNDFESAIDFYYEKGIINSNEADVVEFNALMEFLYLGRKSRRNELLKASLFCIDHVSST